MIPFQRIATREEMSKRIALFADLKGSKGGFLDSDLEGSERELFNVIGFQPPKGAGQVSPVGTEASLMAAIKIAEGFNLGYMKAKPGNGPLMHNHDTNETFIPITGRWRCSWNEGVAADHVDCGPCDVVSFPPGIARCVQNITENDPNTEHVIMFVIVGNEPAQEFTEASKQFATEKTHASHNRNEVNVVIPSAVVA